MIGLRALIAGALRGRTALMRAHTPMRIQKCRSHDEGPMMPFDNMPFKVHSRYGATVFFGFFFGLGLWAPFLILWYSMAKGSL